MGKPSKGFTLIEFAIVIAIIGIVLVYIGRGYGRWSGSNIRNTANKIGVLIQYVRGKAASQGLYARIKFNLSLDTGPQYYTVEYRKSPFLMLTKEEREKLKEESKVKIKDVRIGAKDDANKSNQGSEGKESEEKPPLERYDPESVEGEGFSDIGGDIVSTKVNYLPKGVLIKDVWTSHLGAPVDSGEEYIYIFPNGTVERAVVNLTNTAETVNYHIELDSVLGTAKVDKGYKELKESEEYAR